MKSKVCVRSMVLGAGIMLVGLAVGAIVSPPLIAQREGVFGEIRCTGLKVFDKRGKMAIELYATVLGNGVAVLNKHGGAGIGLAAHEDEAGGNNVMILDKSGNKVVGLGTFSKMGNGVAIFDKQGNDAVLLASDELSNRVTVMDKAERLAIGLAAGEGRHGVTVMDKSG